jgi:hypothetical protein
MRNSLFIEDNIGNFLKTRDGIIYIHTNGWAFITLANFKEKQHSISNWRERFNFYSLCEDTKVTDQELIKLWPHRSRKSYWLEYKTEDPLKSELIKRGYQLNTSGKWEKLK